MTKLIVKEVEAPSFIKKKHDLDGIVKKLKREVEDALEILILDMRDADGKTNAAAAKTILDYYIKATEIRSKDEIMRLVAEHKIKGAGGARQLEIDEGYTRPIVDFTQIRDV